MWLAKTEDEVRAAKKTRRLCGVLLAVMTVALSLYLAAISPAWHGQRVGVVLPIPELVPATAAWLASLVLALADGFWLFRSPAIKSSTLICQKCNRLSVDYGRTQCLCGGKLSGLHEMKWVDGNVNTNNKPPPSARPDGKPPLNALAAAR
jgi:hypothetical protein